MRNKKLLVILLLLVLIQLVMAVEVPYRSIGIVPVNYTSPIVIEDEPEEPSSQPQRIIYIEPENETYEQVPLQGEVVKLDDFEGYYVMLGDLEVDETIHVEFSNKSYSSIQVGKPIIIEQTVTITNTQNQSFEAMLNLWDYLNETQEQQLTGMIAVQILEENQVQSEQLLFTANLSSNQTKEFTIIYEYSPITKTVNCEEKAIIDYLPKGSLITHTDLPLETPVSKMCTVTLTHPSGIPFDAVEVSLEEIDTNLVTSIQHKQSGNNLRLQNNTLHVITP